MFNSKDKPKGFHISGRIKKTLACGCVLVFGVVLYFVNTVSTSSLGTAIKDKVKDQTDVSSMNAGIPDSVPSAYAGPQAPSNTENSTSPEITVAAKAKAVKQWDKERLKAIEQGVKSSIGIQGIYNNNSVAAVTDKKKSGQQEAQTFSQQYNKTEALDQGPTAQKKLLELRAGTIIPSVLITGMNSDLKGTVIAQVKQNVFDSLTGKHLLVPQGSRLIGFYNSHVSYGESRVLIGWDRLIMPDGENLNLDHMEGADTQGLAGFNDETDNHFFRMFASALLSSTISASGQFAQQALADVASGAGASTLQTAGQTLTQPLGSAGSATQGNYTTNIIRPGYQFNVIVQKDIPFEKSYKVEHNAS